MTISTNPEHRQSIFARALAFFERNPDEVLTRADLAVKFDCRIDTACVVAKALIREGIPRSQLPRDDARVELRKRREAKPFPHNLAPAEVRCIEGVIAHGTQGAAAVALGLAISTVEGYLKDARRKAGVKSTALLLQRFQAEAVAT